MDTSIPQSIVQCTFDFSATDLQPIDLIPQVIETHPKLKYCAKGDHWLSLECFSRNTRYKDGLCRICKTCRHDNYLADLARDPEYNKKNNKKQRDAFLEMTPEEQRKVLDRNNQRQNNDPRVKARKKQSRDELRDEIFATYGGVCLDCGETNFAFLSVDHVNNDGSEHRKAGLRGHRLYEWIRKNGFPQDGRFQLLCQNCNWYKHALNLSSNQSDDVSEAAKYVRFWREDLRKETLLAYGGKCACCDEDRPEVLTVDHVHNNGAEHRRIIPGGSPLYTWLRKQGFPQDDYQLLCRSCNFAKQAYSICPHQSVNP